MPKKDRREYWNKRAHEYYRKHKDAALEKQKERNVKRRVESQFFSWNRHKALSGLLTPSDLGRILRCTRTEALERLKPDAGARISGEFQRYLVDTVEKYLKEINFESPMFVQYLIDRRELLALQKHKEEVSPEKQKEYNERMAKAREVRAQKRLSPDQPETL